jgi:type VI secretion system secreted protein Hcp
MAIDTYLKIDGVKGEATHADHKDEIEVLGWSWGVQNASNTIGGGLSQGKADAQQFSFSKLVDKASPTLAKFCIKGDHIKDAVLTVRKSAGESVSFTKITLTAVKIGSTSIGGSQGGESQENVSLAFDQIKIESGGQDDKGKKLGEVSVDWNVKTTKCD